MYTGKTLRFECDGVWDAVLAKDGTRWEVAPGNTDIFSATWKLALRNTAGCTTYDDGHGNERDFLTNAIVRKLNNPPFTGNAVNFQHPIHGWKILRRRFTDLGYEWRIDGEDFPLTDQDWWRLVEAKTGTAYYEVNERFYDFRTNTLQTKHAKAHLLKSAPCLPGVIKYSPPKENEEMSNEITPSTITIGDIDERATQTVYFTVGDTPASTSRSFRDGEWGAWSLPGLSAPASELRKLTNALAKMNNVIPKEAAPKPAPKPRTRTPKPAAKK